MTRATTRMELRLPLDGDNNISTDPSHHTNSAIARSTRYLVRTSTAADRAITTTSTLQRGSRPGRHSSLSFPSFSHGIRPRPLLADSWQEPLAEDDTSLRGAPNLSSDKASGAPAACLTYYYNQLLPTASYFHYFSHIILDEATLQNR